MWGERVSRLPGPTAGTLIGYSLRSYTPRPRRGRSHLWPAVCKFATQSRQAMKATSKRPRVAFVVVHVPQPAGPGYEPQYVERCTASPVRCKVAAWTTDPARARLFSYNVARAVVAHNVGAMRRVNVDEWIKSHRAR